MHHIRLAAQGPCGRGVGDDEGGVIDIGWPATHPGHPPDQFEHVARFIRQREGVDSGYQRLLSRMAARLVLDDGTVLDDWGAIAATVRAIERQRAGEQIWLFGPSMTTA